MSYLHAPLYLLRALAAELPRLRAVATISAARAVAIGTATMKPAELRSAVRDLERAANRPSGRRAAPAPSGPRTAADLERFADSMGVGLTLTKTKRTG